MIQRRLNTVLTLLLGFLASVIFASAVFADEAAFEIQDIYFNEALGVLEIHVPAMPKSLQESDYRSTVLEEPLKQFVVSFPRAKTRVPVEQALPIQKAGLRSVVFSQSSPYSGTLMRVNFESLTAARSYRLFPTSKGFVLSLSGQLPSQIAAYKLGSTALTTPATPGQTTIPIQPQPSKQQGVFVSNQSLKQIQRASYHNGAVLIEALPSDQLQVTNRTVLSDPSRLVLDIEGAQLAGTGKLAPVITTDPALSRVRFGQFDDRTVRVVIETPYPENVIVAYPQNGARYQLLISATSGGQGLQTLPAVNQQVGLIQDVWVEKMPDGKTAIKVSASVPIVRSVEKKGNTVIAQLPNLMGREAPVYFEKADFPFIRSITVSPYQASEPNVKLVVILDSEQFLMEQFLSRDGLYFQLVLTPQPVANEVADGPLPRAPGKKLIVVDAGHGGKDSGATREGIYEKTITLATALKLTKVLESMGYQVVMTRNVDKFLELAEITAITNRVKPDLFVSVHVNSMVKTDVRGIETFYYHDRSLPLAKAVHKQLVSRIKSPDRSVRKAKFYVINHTNVPAILCEMGYISHAQERRELVTAARQQATAEAIARGVTDFLNASK